MTMHHDTHAGGGGGGGVINVVTQELLKVTQSSTLKIV